MGLGGQHHAPAALPPGETRYPLYRRLGGPQGRSGRLRKISPPPSHYVKDVQYQIFPGSWKYIYIKQVVTTLNAAHVLSWRVAMFQHNYRVNWWRFFVLARVQKLHSGINRAVIFWADVATIGRSSIPQFWRSGNGCSWMVANARAQCLPQLYIWTNVKMGRMHKCTNRICWKNNDLSLDKMRYINVVTTSHFIFMTCS